VAAVAEHMEVVVAQAAYYIMLDIQYLLDLVIL
jgi:hypothetical protein